MAVGCALRGVGRHRLGSYLGSLVPAWPPGKQAVVGQNIEPRGGVQFTAVACALRGVGRHKAGSYLGSLAWPLGKQLNLWDLYVFYFVSASFRDYKILCTGGWRDGSMLKSPLFSEDWHPVPSTHEG